MRHFSHLNFNNRLKIEKMLKEGKKQAEIARALRVDPSTISRELTRGTYRHLNSDLTTEERYSPDIAHQNYKRHLSEKGPEVKIGHDHEYAEHIEKKILEEGYSPGAVLGEIEEEGLTFKTKVSKTTLYRYIANGVLGVTNKDLLRKKKKKKKQNQKRAARPPRGESIENRPKEVEGRETPGHWEMDCVEGPKKGSQKTLLVLTERKTRWEILILTARKRWNVLLPRWTIWNGGAGRRSGRFSKRLRLIMVRSFRTLREWPGLRWTRKRRGHSSSSAMRIVAGSGAVTKIKTRWFGGGIQRALILRTQRKRK